MKWVKHNLGDWHTAVAGLSAAKEGAYLRLRDWQYANEDALPHNEEALMNIARATTRGERDAVRAVLGQFFVDTELGYINPQAWKLMREIGLFDDRPRHSSVACHAESVTPQRGAVTPYPVTGNVGHAPGDVTGPVTRAQHVTSPVTGHFASQRQRQRALRERKTRLYDALAAIDVHPRADIGIKALRELCIEHAIDPDTGASQETRPVTSPTPVRTGESHKKKIEEFKARALNSGDCHANSAVTSANGHAPLTAAQAGAVIIAAGMQSMTINLAHPKLLALLDAGCTEAELAGAAAEAVARGKGYAWMLSTLEGRRNEQRPIAAAPDLSAWTAKTSAPPRGTEPPYGSTG